MLNFEHFNPASIDEAASLLAKYGEKAKVVAGGTDLFGLLQTRCLPESKAPAYLINLKSINGLEYIKVDGKFLKIGALTKLDDIAFNSDVLAKAPALAQAARKVASWQIRNMGTIAGNICQGTRCWYYRAAEDKFDCIRKGGKVCYALTGNMREHSVFGPTKACFAAHPSDTAPALVALGASIVTNKATYEAGKFFDGLKDTVLASGEIVTEIQVPIADKKQAFEKAAVRGQIDFAMANVAVALTVSGGKVSDAVIVTNGASTTPLRLTDAEAAINGKDLSDANIAAAAAAGVGKAQADINDTVKYKKAVVEGLIKRALADCK